MDTIYLGILEPAMDAIGYLGYDSPLDENNVSGSCHFTDAKSDGDSDLFGYYGLSPQRCPVCASTLGLRCCPGCEVVSYCGSAHQATHRAKHKQVCNAIKRTRQALEREETTLKSTSHPRVIENVFKEGVFYPDFWSRPTTRGYMRARLSAADALLKIDTAPAVEQALDHFTDMIRLNRMDDLRVRDFIPGLLLRLGHEQECYDFLKWWATVNDSADTTRPYLNIHNADAFEPVDMFCSRTANLSHLVMLTLLKLRLSLDLQAYETRFEFDTVRSDRPLGKLVRSRVRHMSPQRIAKTSTALTAQYHRLCRAVNDRNPHFWDALIDGGTDVSIMPQSYNPGPLEEAQVALHQCKAAWQESEDALVMLEVDTCPFVSVYRGPTTVVAAGDTQYAAPAQTAANMEIRRGAGSVFPTQYNSPETFAATSVGHLGVVWFVSISQPGKVLVYVDGACTNNGQAKPRAGWAVVHGPGDVTFGRLGDKGPFGDDSVATSNRAELRAVIAALRLCDWQTEGFNSLVIATDSTYVVDGATGWARGWVRNGRKTRTGAHVKNKDLWELLLGETERWWDRGVRVALWRIPREGNGEADAWAKETAVARSDEPRFRDVTIEAGRQTAPQTTTLTVNTRLGSNPRILALCLEYEDLFDDCFGSLVSQLYSKAKMERATTTKTALQVLNQNPPPSVILVTDGAITRQKEVFERVVDRPHEGATVVLAGCFSSNVTTGQFDRFFARIGLPWRRGNYRRKTVSLRQQLGNSGLANQLPSAYSQKAVFVKNVGKSAVWYSEGGGSDMAAVAFTKFGLGRLGYIGDVNGEEGSDAAVLTMCGLLG